MEKRKEREKRYRAHVFPRVSCRLLDSQRDAMCHEFRPTMTLARKRAMARQALVSPGQFVKLRYELPFTPMGDLWTMSRIFVFHLLALSLSVDPKSRGVKGLVASNV